MPGCASAAWSAITWLHELDRMLNPDLFHIAPAPGVIADRPASITPVQVQDMFERLSTDPQYGIPTQITLAPHANEPLIAWYRTKPSHKDSPLALQTARQVMVNPLTLEISGERNWGEIGVSRRLLMPTLLHLHRYLLAGDLGKTVIGISGLVLLITSMTGVVLWWPKRNFKAFRQAFTISHQGSWPRFNYSLHRTVGFFSAPVLIVLGFSGWYFNMPHWVLPIVSSVATVSVSEKKTNQAPIRGTPISPGQAMQAALAHYPHARVSRIALPAKPLMPYEIRVRQPGEIRQGDGATRLTIDAYSSQLLQVRDPLRARGGDGRLEGVVGQGRGGQAACDHCAEDELFHACLQVVDDAWRSSAPIIGPAGHCPDTRADTSDTGGLRSASRCRHRIGIVTGV
eukprot:gene31092-38425_t